MSVTFQQAYKTALAKGDQKYQRKLAKEIRKGTFDTQLDQMGLDRNYAIYKLETIRNRDLKGAAKIVGAPSTVFDGIVKSGGKFAMGLGVLSEKLIRKVQGKDPSESKLMQNKLYRNLYEDTEYKNIGERVGGIGFDLVGMISGAGALKRGTKKLVDKAATTAMRTSVKETAEQAAKASVKPKNYTRLQNGVNKTFNVIDEAVVAGAYTGIQEGDAQVAKNTAALDAVLNLTLKGAGRVFKKFSTGMKGVDDATKKFIQEAPPEKIVEYSKVSKNALGDLRAPGPVQHAAAKVPTVVKKIQDVMNDVGNPIGSLRRKIKTYKVNIDDINKLEDNFKKILERKGLRLSTKKSYQGVKGFDIIKGEEPKLTKKELRTIKELYEGVVRLKQQPKLSMALGLRDKFSKYIDFNKKWGEISSDLDDLSSSSRKILKEANLKAVGKEQAALFEEYSNLKGFMQDMSKYQKGTTDREALFIKRLFGDQSRITKPLNDVIKKYTGEDLMEDAILAETMTKVFDIRQSQSQLQKILGATAESVVTPARGVMQFFSTALDIAANQRDARKAIAEIAKIDPAMLMQEKYRLGRLLKDNFDIFKDMSPSEIQGEIKNVLRMDFSSSIGSLFD